MTQREANGGRGREAAWGLSGGVRGRAALLAGLLALPAAGWTAQAAEPPSRVWFDVAENSLAAPASEGFAPNRYRTLGLDIGELLARLGSAPLEATEQARQTAVVLELPWPTGGYRRFRIEESPVMAPELAAQFPELKTYRGQGIDDGSATVRLDWTPAGFHAMALSPEGSVWIDPYSATDLQTYRSYFAADYQRPDGDIPRCLVTGEEAGPAARDATASGPAPGSPSPLRPANGAQLRTYRLALAATGEYTAFHGGTVAGAMNAIVTTLNRVNEINERDMAVRMVLIGNNASLIYTDAPTDPYTNGNGTAMLAENQTNLTNVIGSANYDIGHAFSTGPGGIAYVASVCWAAFKAGAVSGSSSPTGDVFAVDLVAHEMGHQLAAQHTFNGTTSNCGGGNRSASTAFEPGSGSTILAYAGICGAENLQTHRDPYFHAGSLDQTVAFINNVSTGASCGTPSATGNTPPTANAGPDYTIPRSTPFTLTAIGSDVDGDSLTYTWEELDLGTASPPNTDDGSRPLFRSFPPTSSPSRTFPRLSDILNGTSTLGESLPTTTRSMHLVATVRDNRAGGGGTTSDEMILSVRADSGPFLVTEPNTPVSWLAGSPRTVTWDVANTAAPPVGVANVKISLSTDGGNTFPVVLAASTSNDGSEAVALPDTPSSTARIKVEAVGNVFFDISNVNFSITPAPPFTLTVAKSGNGSGTVTSIPAGISCGADCAEVYAGGSLVTLTATPGAGHVFTGWSGDADCADGSLTMNASKTCFATFSKAVRPADFDGDGKSDVLWHHALAGAVYDWRMDGPTVVSQNYVGTVSDTNWEIKGYADQTGDGKADLLWRHKLSGGVYLWPMNGPTPQSQTYVGTVDAAYEIVGFGDYDGDGKSDILWRHNTLGDTWVWLMDGATKRSQTYLASPEPGYEVAGSGDFDLDGKTDVLWRHKTVGAIWIWRMNGSNPPVVSYVGTVDPGYEVVRVGDFDGDGKWDVLWRHKVTGDIWIWVMNGVTPSPCYVGVVNDLDWEIVASGDYDGDAKADILWRHKLSGGVYLWRMNGCSVLSQTPVGQVADTNWKIVRLR